MAKRWTTLGRDLFLYRDSCNVYLLRDGERAIAIDIGVAAVDHVVLSHAHRDQLCGLYRGGRGDFAVHAPAGDRDLLMPCARADFWRHYQHNGCPSSYAAPRLPLADIAFDLAAESETLVGPARFCGDAVHAGGAVQQSYHLEWDMDYDYRALHFEPFVNRARPGARLQLKRVSRNRSAATRALEAAIAAPEDWRIDVPRRRRTIPAHSEHALTLALHITPRCRPRPTPRRRRLHPRLPVPGRGLCRANRYHLRRPL